MFILSTLLIGISLQVPDVMGSVLHDVGRLKISSLTDFGRILYPLQWPSLGSPQSTTEGPWQVSFIGLVIDHDNYNHTSGSVDIADCFKTYPYNSQDDFKITKSGQMIVNDGITQMSMASFHNQGTQDPYDILVNQTAWSLANKDWFLIQWDVINLKDTDITGLCIGIELSLSQVGTGILYGVGGDSGDDIDDYDSVHSTYYVQDDDGTCLGFASAVVSDPITHHYSQDYSTTFDKLFYENETWLYERIHAPNTVVGAIPGNRTSTVGWNEVTIPAGSSKNFALVMAINDTYDNMITAVEDARHYYHYSATGFRISEFSDSSSGAQRIEIFNHGRGLTNLSGPAFSLSVNDGTLVGSWTNNPVPNYGYAVFTRTEGASINPEGDIIRLWENGTLLDMVSFGQRGVAPDPLNGESVARRYNAILTDYIDEWVRNASTGPTWGVQNDVGSIISSPQVVLNRVMFNPLYEVEGYIELRYRGFGALDIQGYRIVCDDEFFVPSGTVLDLTNKLYELRQVDSPTFFSNLNETGDNIYLYDNNGNLLDMVGWDSPHGQGEYMSRIPEGDGTHQGFNDITSQVAGWFFNQLPDLTITEFFMNSTSAQIELYNPRGGDKVLDSRWSFIVNSGGLTGIWFPNIISSKGYASFNMTGGSPCDEGDTIRLYYAGSEMDDVSFGIKGMAPDPPIGESTARIWDDSMQGYSNEWSREDIPSFGVQNDVPSIDPASLVVLNEVMFNPNVPPEGRYIRIINKDPFRSVDVSNFYLVCNDVYKFPAIPPLDPYNMIIIDHTNASSLFQNMESGGDNVYFYNNAGSLIDMVGWDSPHIQGMNMRRIPDGNGTNQGYNDTTSESAGWVFNSPLDILITEISDNESTQARIEVYNPWFPPINFSVGFTFESASFGTLSGEWSIPIADRGGYALFDVTSSWGLNSEGDTISIYQNSVLNGEVSYGQEGTVPDPLPNESVERVMKSGHYTNTWSRNWTSGPTFGSENDVPHAIVSPSVVLNEIMFNPKASEDGVVELYYRSDSILNISGYKIVGDKEHNIPAGTFLTREIRFFYLTQPTDKVFFTALNPSGDNIYLYDNNGVLLDMVGWSSAHDINRTMERVPDGEGRASGFNDSTSEDAGWVFNRLPSFSLVLIKEEQEKWGDPGNFVWYSLKIGNLQASADYIDVMVQSENDWTVELYEANQITQLVDKETPPDGLPDTGLLNPYRCYLVWLKIYIPPSPKAGVENTKVIARASSNTLWVNSVVLVTILNPWMDPDAYIEDPPYTTTMYEKSAGVLGFINETTITLNATGKRFQNYTGQDVIFILDSSGSMRINDPDPDGIPGNIPFPKRVEASWVYVNNLNGEDRGGYVDFDSQATLKVPLTMDYTYLKQDPNNGLWTSDQEGNTEINPALSAANQEMIDNGDPNHVKIEILLTDAEIGDLKDDIECREQADIAAANDIMIFTIGLNISQPGPIGGIDLLTYIASSTGGKYFPAPDASALTEIFSQILRMVNNIAGYNPDPAGEEVLVKFVLGQGIEYIDGTFELLPGTIETDPKPDVITFNPTNTTLEWYWFVDYFKVGQFWAVRFNISSTLLGTDVPVNIIPDSTLIYMTGDRVIITKEFPLVTINVLPPPIQPHITNVTVEPGGVNIKWNSVIGAEMYEIYGGPSQTSLNLDLTDVLDTVSSPQTWWLDTIRPALYNEYYYVVRAVDTGTMPETRSFTSNTGGFYKKQFSTGLNTFSIPLEPFANFYTDWYTSHMNAEYIKYMDQTTHIWTQHNLGDGSTNNVQMKLSEGYQVKFSSQTTFTFTGMPGAMMSFDDDSGFSGFDPLSEAKNLTVSIQPYGDVNLTWPEPSSMSDGRYEVYYSHERDGFFKTLDVNYYRIGSPIDFRINTVTHIGISAENPGTRLYYMVVPFNSSGVRGSSTYSIGIWTESYDQGYDTFGLPLKLNTTHTMDWYCDAIDNTWGMNYYNVAEQRWMWHKTIMPEGIYDVDVMMGEGYQVSTTSATKFTFVGV